MKVHVRSRAKYLMPALAAAAIVSAAPAFAKPEQTLPQEHHAGPVTYLSGGIGRDEANAIKRAAAKYPLEVELLKKSRDGRAEYLADDRVVIRGDGGKTVLDTKAGPYLLARLAPGHYMVSATDEGVMKMRKVNIAAHRHEHVVFEW